MTAPGPKPRLRVTEIGEYIRHYSCDRRFKLELNNRQLARALPFAERLFNALDPVLQEAGRKREDEWEESLQEAGIANITRYGERPDDEKATSWSAFIESLQEAEPNQDAYGREIQLSAELGAFNIEGRIDFVLALWEDARPRLRLVECKASRRDRTYQRVQVTLYRMLVLQLMQDSPISICGVALLPEDIECVVARIDESTNESQSILELEPLNSDEIAMIEADIDRLLALDGYLFRIHQTDLADLNYQLDTKCDGCVFNVHCLPESARERRLELLGMDTSTARVLHTAGVINIDQLADIDLNGPEAIQVRQDPNFAENLELLRVKARARRRTLPGGDADPDTYEVEALPHMWQSQLPEHEINGVRLVRIYLSVDYDYTENRLGALSAHITTSDHPLHTGFIQDGGNWRLDPIVKERWETGVDEQGHRSYAEGPLRGKDIVEFIPSEWTGRYEVDTGAEKQLIQGFLQKLVDAIAEVAEAEQAPIHFYIWSRSEMTRLIEACSRVSSRLLGHLRELLGCRESLEQLIYSCVHDEADRRYALGWTGRGLAVVTSLRWFGRRYHWHRRVAGAEVGLDKAFTQDIFDFKTDLDIRVDGSWAPTQAERAAKHKFEIRSRFHDSLTAPYWRAYWRTLPDPDDRTISAPVRNAIRRYNEAARPGYLREYLRARVHSLRWVEEGIRFKNPDIIKPLMVIADLPSFTLGVDNAAQAAIDFLRLDQHVKVTDWIALHLTPPINRVVLGRTIPVCDVVSHGNNELTTTINLDAYNLTRSALESICTIGPGSFVRISPCSPDPHAGQTIGQLTRAGKTCRVNSIDWQTGQVTLTALWMNASRYMLQSAGANDPGDIFDHATIDENISDFVAGRVEDRLRAGWGAYLYQWLDPEEPNVPEQLIFDVATKEQYRVLLTTLELPGNRRLAPDQVTAAIDGLDTRIQLMLGPPGTGKTMTTAVATLLRILARGRAGDIVLVAAHTHTAIDNLLLRLDGSLDAFSHQARASGFVMPPIKLSKVHSSQIAVTGGRIIDFVSKPCATFVNRERGNAVLIIGGTTGAILKMAGELSERLPFRNAQDRFQVPLLVVDEASMMVFPHFLALATLATHEGEIMLAGDHRQLAPITAHDWEREDRPPVVIYQPFASAYEAIQNIERNNRISDRAVRQSALRFTFRLPPLIRDLIARLYRLRDNIELEGLPRVAPEIMEGGGSWESIWQGEWGLYLVLHSERQSRQSNEAEAQIIEHILAAGGMIPNGSVAIVTPHRAQRSLLKTRLPAYSDRVDVIDTVERLQGGERPTVIVSATASDSSAISMNAEFILDLNRSNVAFSRAQDRLIVVCSEALLDSIPPEIEHYDSAMLWKSLRALCSRLIATEQLGETSVRIFTPALEQL